MKKIAIVLALMLLLTGCGAKGPESRTLFAMDTVMDISVWGKEKTAAADALETLIREMEDRWSATDRNSIPSQMNGEGTVLYTEDIRFLDQVEALSKRTGGAFDPMLHSVISLWGFLDDNYRVPTQQELETALAEEKWNLGAVVKGYTGRRAVELLQTMDVDRAILNLGGNVQTYGEKADGTPWQIAVQNPDGSGNLGILSVTGTMAVVTSGDYQRYFEENGVRYHHIIDPATGYPSDSGLRSVTVLCRSGLTADALSTALYVMGLEKGTEFWRQSNDFEAVFVTADGTVFATEGTALSGCEYEVIAREN